MRPLVHVLPRGEDLIARQLAGDHPGVPGVFPEPANLRQVPGREQEVWEYYRKNPGAVAAVRAPIFEEKVVDFLVELATVTEKQISREELLKDEEDEKSATAQS